MICSAGGFFLGQQGVENGVVGVEVSGSPAGAGSAHSSPGAPLPPDSGQGSKDVRPWSSCSD